MRNLSQARELALELHQAGDSNAMRDAIKTILAEGFTDLWRPSAYQLKVGEVNFYPDKGTVQIDGLKKQKVRGLAEFFRTIRHESAVIRRG